jgi:hypothetical protein
LPANNSVNRCTFEPVFSAALMQEPLFVLRRVCRASRDRSRTHHEFRYCTRGYLARTEHSPTNPSGKALRIRGTRIDARLCGWGRRPVPKSILNQ